MPQRRTRPCLHPGKVCLDRYPGRVCFAFVCFANVVNLAEMQLNAVGLPEYSLGGNRLYTYHVHLQVYTHGFPPHGFPPHGFPLIHAWCNS